MKKMLSETSLEELWTLFPISLTAPAAHWADWYREEEANVKAALPAESIARISHIGSTAIDGIWAKPIVDILVEVWPDGDKKAIMNALLRCGYICMAESDERISWNKGYTENGFAQKVYHLHVTNAGDNDELYFRDYLNEHKDAAKEYEAKKLALWKQFEHDRDGYTAAKGECIAAYTQKAKLEFSGRYDTPRV